MDPHMFPIHVHTHSSSQSIRPLTLRKFENRITKRRVLSLSANGKMVMTRDAATAAASDRCVRLERSQNDFDSVCVCVCK